jgi:probable rRNA maturation factor
MTLVIDVASDGIRAPLASVRVRNLATFVLQREKVREALLSIAFVSNRVIAQLNRTHLGHAGTTDVISFALTGAPGAVVGDIYIAPDVAREHAREHRVGIRDEIARLVVHGVLHVIGYDHPEDDDREHSAMWRRQERLLAQARGRFGW